MFYLKKISETNTSQVQNRGYSTDVFGSRSFRLKFAQKDHWKWLLSWVEKLLPAASPVQECFRKVICLKIMETAIPQIVVSLYTVDFLHTVRLGITATPQAGSFFHRNTAQENAQHHNSPVSPSWNSGKNSKQESFLYVLLQSIIKWPRFLCCLYNFLINWTWTVSENI